jgi:hypothetical protein
MTSPEDMSYLQCKICNKEFPKYDQRGFRNAGFTAHQNRCIEREYSLKNPTVEQPPLSHKRRLLLPAPSPPRDSSMMVSSGYYTLTNNQSEPFTFVNAPPPFSMDLSLFSNVNHRSVDINPSSSFDLNAYNTDNLERVPERFFPITQCDYCTPEHGLHQPNCLLLADIVSQAPSDFPPL